MIKFGQQHAFADEFPVKLLVELIRLSDAIQLEWLLQDVQRLQHKSNTALLFNYACSLLYFADSERVSTEEHKAQVGDGGGGCLLGALLCMQQGARPTFPAARFHRRHVK